MKKIIAILGISMLLLIQFGSVGFNVFKNECNNTKTSTYTLEHVGCVCAKNHSEKEVVPDSCCKKEEKKSCCKTKVKKKTCCSKKSDSETASKKCCNTDVMLFKVFCESFTINFTDLTSDTNDIDEYIAITPVYKTAKVKYNYNSNNGKYNCNSPPPLLDVNRRILIQSFQI